MLAEMKQNEMNLILQGIWGSSKSISDMISRPEIINQNYIPSGTLIDAFDFYSSLEPGSPEFEAVDWTKTLWRVGAHGELTNFVKRWPGAKKTLEICDLM